MSADAHKMSFVDRVVVGFIVALAVVTVVVAVFGQFIWAWFS